MTGIDYQPDAREIPIASLKDGLDLTSLPNWGYQLRSGLIALFVLLASLAYLDGIEAVTQQ